MMFIGEPTNLHGADGTLQIESTGDGLAGELGLGDVRQERPSIDVDGVAARWRQDGDSHLLQALPKIPR